MNEREPKEEKPSIFEWILILTEQIRFSGLLVDIHQCKPDLRIGDDLEDYFEMEIKAGRRKINTLIHKDDQEILDFQPNDIVRFNFWQGYYKKSGPISYKNRRKKS